MSDTPVTAVIIPFPARPQRPADEGNERLQRTLAGLDRALADQRMAIAAWRRAIGELHATVGGLGGSLERYRGSLDGLATRVEGLREQPVQLERTADAAMAIAAD